MHFQYILAKEKYRMHFVISLSLELYKNVDGMQNKIPMFRMYSSNRYRDE